MGLLPPPGGFPSSGLPSGLLTFLPPPSNSTSSQTAQAFDPIIVSLLFDPKSLHMPLLTLLDVTMWHHWSSALATSLSWLELSVSR